MLLLTNDDGFDAPGLAALARAVGESACWLAPDGERSECGHSMTTRTPMEVEERAPGRFAVSGCPADCARLGLAGILGSRPAWVLSGINAGGNLGIDQYMSGTLAAAREAAIHGVPAVAFSHYRKSGRALDWDLASQRVARVWRLLQPRAIRPGEFWNVNLPHLEPDAPEPPVFFCPVSEDPLPLSYSHSGKQYAYSGVYPQRHAREGTDVAHCFAGAITVSRLRVR